MPIHTFQSLQNLPISMDVAWDFLSDPKNLAIITPSHMQFEIRGGDEKKMFQGQIIHYTVKPIFGIKVEWVTEITHVDRKTFFVDEQRVGPYKMWHHKHFLKEIEGGVEMEDVIHYQLPLGIIGNSFHNLLVKPRIEQIFEFRKNKLTELFGTL